MTSVPYELHMYKKAVMLITTALIFYLWHIDESAKQSGIVYVYGYYLSMLWSKNLNIDKYQGCYVGSFKKLITIHTNRKMRNPTTL